MLALSDTDSREAVAMAALLPSCTAIRLTGSGITPLPIGEGGLLVPELDEVRLLPGLGDAGTPHCPVGNGLFDPRVATPWPPL